MPSHRMLYLSLFFVTWLNAIAAAGESRFAARVSETKAHLKMLADQITTRDANSLAFKRLYEDTAKHLESIEPEALKSPIFGAAALIKRPNGDIVFITFWLTDSVQVDHLCLWHQEQDLELRFKIPQWYLKENLMEVNGVLGRCVEIFAADSLSGILGNALIDSKKPLKAYLESNGETVGTDVSVIVVDLREGEKK